MSEALGFLPGVYVSGSCTLDRRVTSVGEANTGIQEANIFQSQRGRARRIAPLGEAKLRARFLILLLAFSGGFYQRLDRQSDEEIQAAAGAGLRCLCSQGLA